ncbi:hypothetical protein ACTHPF_21705 [Paenibacillus sp. SAF-054]|uniref:hypothetical protein n=1 Tax=Paenibacillus sp. SAFN-054 TaxID=3436865 RepID=UPI003F81197D
MSRIEPLYITAELSGVFLLKARIGEAEATNKTPHFHKNEVSCLRSVIFFCKMMHLFLE